MNDIIRKGVLVLFIVALFSYSFWNFDINLSITLLLLLGTWTFDAFLKFTYGFKNETLFADFSFGALVFSGGYWINLFMSRSFLDNNEILLITKYLIISFILGFIWVGNLFLCQGLIQSGRNPKRKPTLINEKDTKRYLTIWAFSAICAILSLIGAIYPQIQELI